MSLHINRFIDKIKSAESQRQRDVILTINEARDLHGDITKLLLQLNAQAVSAPVAEPEATTVEIQGGSF